MRESLQSRLQELKEEFKIGQSKLLDAERHQLGLRETLLRISGAIQVLEELLEHDSAEGPPEVLKSVRSAGGDKSLNLVS